MQTSSCLHVPGANLLPLGYLHAAGLERLPDRLGLASWPFFLVLAS